MEVFELHSTPKPLGLMVDSFVQLLSPETAGSPVDFATALQRAVQAVEASGFDFVIVRDNYRVAVGENVVRPRLDPYMTAAFLSHSVPGDLAYVVESEVALFEPFHIAKNLQTLDHSLGGRLGWLPSMNADSFSLSMVSNAGSGALDKTGSYFREFLNVVTGLWDTWEEGAIIRDAATGRYLDPSKVHYLNHVGEHFSVRGPSLSPRSPQGRLPIFAIDGEGSPSVAADDYADIIVTEDLRPRGNADRVEGAQRYCRIPGADISFGRIGEGFDGGVIDVTGLDDHAVIRALAAASDRSGGTNRTRQSERTLRSRTNLGPATSNNESELQKVKIHA
ncbi:hypothetical protein B2J88_02925 [Rhodococcus sp. SRB_17]|nr:hypothetical protein [Rhodococcus sp. SRB_17]